ncbi:hypothetical protein [Rhodococcus erythropolis]|uniref:hypothetical protein n=1 Tax=Rhodococcus erythropolis TaxID=1833 RepID=UPI001BE91C60|nr:hypothetical protein [Rhodococcus erythropolis]MBT2269597.1 hypothetical protein [Rhodococcus erythropolis]
MDSVERADIQQQVKVTVPAPLWVAVAGSGALVAWTAGFAVFWFALDGRRPGDVYEAPFMITRGAPAAWWAAASVLAGELMIVGAYVVSSRFREQWNRRRWPATSGEWVRVLMPGAAAGFSGWVFFATLQSLYGAAVWLAEDHDPLTSAAPAAFSPAGVPHWASWICIGIVVGALAVFMVAGSISMRTSKRSGRFRISA